MFYFSLTYLRIKHQRKVQIHPEFFQSTRVPIFHDVSRNELQLNMSRWWNFVISKSPIKPLWLNKKEEKEKKERIVAIKWVISDANSKNRSFSSCSRQQLQFERTVLSAQFTVKLIERATFSLQPAKVPERERIIYFHTTSQRGTFVPFSPARTIRKFSPGVAPFPAKVSGKLKTPNYSSLSILRYAGVAFKGARAKRGLFPREIKFENENGQFSSPRADPMHRLKIRSNG